VTAVFVVAGVRLYRDGLARILGRRRGIEIVGTAADWPEARERLRTLRPAVVLLDLGLPEGFEAVRELTRIAPETRVVALGVREADADVVAWAEAGVAGYVTRDGTIDDCVASVEAVARGELACSPRIAATLLRRVTLLAGAEPPPEPHPPALTPREREIAELINDGLSNKQIAARLSIEVPTVKNHVHNILEKLRVTRRGEAAARIRGAAARASL
jgi:DNA-binding NarL/FixJ family response regulator